MACVRRIVGEGVAARNLVMFLVDIAVPHCRKPTSQEPSMINRIGTPRVAPFIPFPEPTSFNGFLPINIESSPRELIISGPSDLSFGSVHIELRLMRSPGLAGQVWIAIGDERGHQITPEQAGRMARRLTEVIEGNPTPEAQLIAIMRDRLNVIAAG
jgi:hypothetical protein